jgi:hypothetical protein
MQLIVELGLRVHRHSRSSEREVQRHDAQLIARDHCSTARVSLQRSQRWSQAKKYQLTTGQAVENEVTYNRDGGNERACVRILYLKSSDLAIINGASTLSLNIFLTESWNRRVNVP